MAGRVSSQARPRGRHALRSRAFADELVRDAGLAPGSLVLDLGAGGGVITGALVAAGARVRAVELDQAALHQLTTRFAGDRRVDVVQEDATTVALPGEPFAVVANLPFAHGTAILRRLLGDPAVRLVQLDAIVEWGLAAKPLPCGRRPCSAACGERGTSSSSSGACRGAASLRRPTSTQRSSAQRGVRSLSSRKARRGVTRRSCAAPLTLRHRSIVCCHGASSTASRTSTGSIRRRAPATSMRASGRVSIAR